MRWPVAALAVSFSVGLSMLAASCGGGSGVSASTTGGGGASATSTTSSMTTTTTGGIVMDGGNGCTPKTCADLGIDCGPAGDGCGSIIKCGSCKPPETCGGGKKPSSCGGNTGCVPQTCAGAKAGCGPIGDGCGNLVDCGKCKAPETCGGGGMPSECGGNNGCVPTTCMAQNVNCGPIGDGCGGLLQCGQCAAPEVCGGGVKPSVCAVPVKPDGGPVCVPTTCAAQNVNCGPIGDGCGNQLDCGSCTPPATCGGGGKASVCGGNQGCVPTSCAVQNVNCGPIGDGCGNVLQCGACVAPQTCGGGGTPGTCGGNNNCVPATCASLSANCGFVGDGCGGILQCGACVAPQICGGGNVANQCSGGVVPCVNLCKNQVVCPNNGTTSITGTIYAPNGVDPIYNALVYVPNAPVLPFTGGVACDQCGEAASGSPLVSAFSAVDGTFTITNVPVGSNIPIVIQLGRWRRQVVIPTVTQCVNNPLSVSLSHLPSVQTATDNIPLMGFVTGDVDALECALRKIGIADSEFGDPGAGLTVSPRVRFYSGDGFGGATYSGNTPGEDQLWGTQAAINQYDMVYFACQGNEYDQAAASQQIVINYASAGGRIFATHYSYVWLFNDAPFSGTAAWDVNQFTNFSSDPQTGYIVTNFPKGQALAQWLQIVGASATYGQMPINTLRNDFDSVISPSQLWIYLQDPNYVNPVPMHMTFNTPVNVPAAQQCGRVLYDDFHVEDAEAFGTNGYMFPGECQVAGMTPQEKMLEFMIFDLSSCITPDVPPPPSCTPQTCKSQGFSCGPQGDGCGNELMCGSCPMGQTCGGGGQPGVCGGMPCVSETCAGQGIKCGPAGDGCGNQLDCGACPMGQACGGGGKAGVCGAPMCVPESCAKLGLDCGPAGDGCGGLLQCGVCAANQKCGANGKPGVCGGLDAGACTPETCTQQGIQCGPAGDGCGNEIMCGSCPAGQTCGANGKPGICGKPICAPETCASQSIQCGPAGDGCGNVLMCGNCPPGETCGGGGKTGVCGKPSCTPSTCMKLKLNCGPAGDGCGGLLECGTCAAPTTCGGGGTPGVCGGNGAK